MKVEGKITEAEAISFRAPKRFFHTETGITNSALISFGALSYINEEPGAPKEEPSYYRSFHDGNYGVQVRKVARRNGWRTYEEQG